MLDWGKMEGMVIKPTVWVQPGVVIIYGSSLDAAPHNHHAIQVIWPNNDALCKLNSKATSTLTIIDSNVEHQLQLSAGWILLVEPMCELGQALTSKLAGQSVSRIPLTNHTELVPTKISDVAIQLAPLFDALSLQHSIFALKTTVQDKRVQELIADLDLCLQGDCIKPTHWRASEVAEQLALSESRFLHLFSQELGIAWRPYLLWRRMMCAIQALINKSSATEAAHLAGFSDSAHLSRTFKKNFGMTIRQASSLFAAR